ncbi:MAG: radical SAM protein [Peptococcaceae bacterium BICA1-8]|nr:MAG: radical SAM protein [Peptococcaceae bacterium BICA1-8]
MFHFVYADEEGNAYDHENLYLLGRLGNSFVEPTEEELIPLPQGAGLTLIPNRTAVVMDRQGEFKKYRGPGFVVGALLPQGYTRTLLPAFINEQKAQQLPLFGYAAVGYKNGGFYAAARATDIDDKWNPKHFNTVQLEEKVHSLREKFPHNRIIKQLSYCALEYSCFTAQNIFYERWEGGIPVSPACNASCLGCISLQPAECCPSPQSRIGFLPNVEEIVQLGLHHLVNEGEPIISFGQGCEGEPSLQADLIAEAIVQIRNKTKCGTINMNTNAGNTLGIKKLCSAGIDSLRVSLNSAKPGPYTAYYQPQNYTLENVKDSLRIASAQGVYTYLNLLFFPGINDCEDEVEALIELIIETGVKAIQLRNLNIDPDVLIENIPAPQGEPLGVPAFLEVLSKELPKVEVGNYTKPIRS